MEVYLEKSYLDILKFIFENGINKPSRINIPTRSYFEIQMRFDLSTDYFLTVITKKLYFKSVKNELLWF